MASGKPTAAFLDMPNRALFFPLRLNPARPIVKPLSNFRWISTTFDSRITQTPRHIGSIPSAMSPANRTFTAIPENVEPDALFRYTSGRWLINEKHQLAQRYVKFDVNNLCQLAESMFGDSTICVQIEKMEGSFNKALRLTMNDGNKVIAKIPCPNAGPPFLTTASEVATLKFLQSYTKIRVPEVLAWNANPENSVGAEYIIMENIPGVALSERWETMSVVDRYKLIDRVVEMEKELVGFEFPASGSLFLLESIPSGFQRHLLPSTLDPTQSFCIGPFCCRSWWHDNKGSTAESTPERGPGPWTSLTEFVLSITRREIAYRIDSASNGHDGGWTTSDYVDLLDKASEILSILSYHPRVLESSAPILWHTDLNLANIFVSLDDPTRIEGIIDWQSSKIAPLFLQARIPVFLEPPGDYVPGTNIPKLPDNFDELSVDQQQQAIREKESAFRTKYYEMKSLEHNRRVYDALHLDRRLWELFANCQLTTTGSIVPLRNCLIRLSQDWSLLGLPGECPFTFTAEELGDHEKQVTHYHDRVYLWNLAKEQLCTDDDGWVPIYRWEETTKLNRYLFDMFVETMSEEISPEAAAKKWPFPPEGCHSSAHLPKEIQR